MSINIACWIHLRALFENLLIQINGEKIEGLQFGKQFIKVGAIYMYRICNTLSWLN